ncbi:hypothetical protein TNCV_2418281 [Trichonephila clavipes]|nr:hypothetical protein TNCV_2418281 [Trichonephila clavipes]
MSQDCLRHITTLLWPARFPDLSPIKHIWWYHGGVTSSWTAYEFGRIRGVFAAALELDVSGHHTELVCINARSYRIVHSR